MSADDRPHLVGMTRTTTGDDDVGIRWMPIDQEMLVVGILELRDVGCNDWSSDEPRQPCSDIGVDLIEKGKRRRAVAVVGVHRHVADDWGNLQAATNIGRRPAQRIA